MIIGGTIRSIITVLLIYLFHIGDHHILEGDHILGDIGMIHITQVASMMVAGTEPEHQDLLVPR